MRYIMCEFVTFSWRETTWKTNLFTAVTDSSMVMVTSRAATRHDQTFQTELTVVDEREGVSWMVAMNVMEKTGHAKIVVLAVGAGNHLGFIKFCQILDYSSKVGFIKGKEAIPLRQALQIRSSH